MVLEMLNNGDVFRGILFLATFSMVPFVGIILKKILKKISDSFTSKTDTKFDDALVESISGVIYMTLVYFVLLGGFLYLNVSEIKFYRNVTDVVGMLTVVIFIVKFMNHIIEESFKTNKRAKKNKAAIGLMKQVSTFMLYSLGVLIILSNFGFNISALIAGLGVGGLAFALAAQDVLKNFFSGVSLIFDKTFNVGDKVNFQGNAGVIEDLKLRSTKLRTYDGTLLTIPNSMLSENIVENVTKVPKVKVAQTFGVTYDTSSKKLKKAKEIIKNAILSEDLASDDGITIWFDNFGGSSLDIQVIYYSTLDMSAWPERVHVKERVNFKILEGFEKAKIEFAFPSQTVYVKK